MTITTVENCVYDSIYNDFIHVYDYPSANFNYSPAKVPMFNPKVDITNSSSYDATKWWWTLDGAKPNSATTQDVSIEYPQGEVKDYNVKLIVENADGCYDSISKIISVVSDVIVYAPNSFTPDGDSFNEKWRVFTQGLDEYGFTLLIYNRWGEVLWESHNINAEWDGTYGGKIVPDGAYVWVIHAKSAISDQKFEFKGNISIMR
jgi:gliding motility-associated-like protein